jgi:hypothetical protein
MVGFEESELAALPADVVVTLLDAERLTLCDEVSNYCIRLMNAGYLHQLCALRAEAARLQKTGLFAHLASLEREARRWGSDGENFLRDQPERLLLRALQRAEAGDWTSANVLLVALFEGCQGALFESRSAPRLDFRTGVS